MSADNGVYILITPSYNSGHEYRVQDLQAVDNYSWNDVNGRHTDNPDILIRNAQEMWATAAVFHNESDAVAAAVHILQTLDVCEYGISFIEINRDFKTGGRCG